MNRLRWILVCFRQHSLLWLATMFMFLPMAVASAQRDIADSPAAEQPVSGLQYELMEFHVEIDPGQYLNPFDVADIELIGIFRSPSGQQWVVPGFWMQPYEDQCQIPCTLEDLQPVGEPLWRIRLAPDEVGEWTYSLQVRDDGVLITSEDGQYTIAPSDKRGYIRVANNQQYFQYDNGESYFPIGHNLKWSWDGGGGLVAYREWLRELSAAGGNYARLFIDVPWFIGLEWEGPAGDYRAEQATAARLDSILDLADEEGIALQLVLLWHQSLRTYTGAPVLIPQNPSRPEMSADWDNHPYNALNGGPLSGPGIFFFDQEARELFLRRLRYIVARWGYSPQVFAWEVVDEIDEISNYDPAIADEWLQDAISFLRQIDPQRHLITAGSRSFEPAIMQNPLLDFTQGRFFQRLPIEVVSDQVAGVLTNIRQNQQANPIPTLMTEFSLNPWFEPTTDDPTGVHFQNTLWAAALSGAGGSAASEWWDTYVLPQGLQQHYAPLAAFTTGIDWANLNLKSAEAALLSEDRLAYEAYRVNEFDRRFLAPGRAEVETHVVTAEGVFPNLEEVTSYLYGQVFSNQLSQAQHYLVTLPVDTYLEVRVRAVSEQADARLIVQVDGRVQTELDLNRGSRNIGLRVPLSAGEHTIVLDNLGDDWLELEYLEIGQLRAAGRALTLRDEENGVALAWIQHRGYTWERVAAGDVPVPKIFTYQLGGMPNGDYSVEIWHPLSGAVLGQELLNVDDGILQVGLLPLENQLALRIFLQETPIMPDDSSDTAGS